MSQLYEGKKGEKVLFMGNQAIARGALEAGVSVAAGYPGTPSSEIIENLADVSKEANMYVEWSANEKIAVEVAAAASFAGLRSMCTMKQNGVNVASDFLLHLVLSGTRGGMVLVPCDDPGALSSINEGEARHFAKLLEIPLLEAGDFQEAKDMLKWAFELSEEIHNLVMFRSVTRLSHASGSVELGEIPHTEPQAKFVNNGFILDPLEGPIVSAPVGYKHGLQQDKLKKAEELFEESPFNTYVGPENPEILLITSSGATLYSREAIHLCNAKDKVGLLKLGTTFPLPSKLIAKHLKTTDKVLVVEEVLPFMEENLKVLAQELAPEVGQKTFYGKRSGNIPMTGELNPDLVATALATLLGDAYSPQDQEYQTKAAQQVFFNAPVRDLTFCPGCPHRASFWSIHNVLAADNREGFVCGDIGCYSMAFLPSGFSTLKTLHAMGSGTGVASGFGKLGQFGLDQPVVSVCGDSTFFHSGIPALVNAIHHKSDITMVILDNSGTGMTGFQSHPGLPVDAQGNESPALDIPTICRALGATVEVCDPFYPYKTQQTFHKLLEAPGAKVLVLRQICALSPEKKGKKQFEMSVDEDVCLGENCGCNKLCTRVFRCPGLRWDEEKKVATIDEVICAGCGMCAAICPSGAITRKEVA
ncbi:thiamine pyrophosphate-dependent enzyme [Desulfatibacillum aliphaticivorans]|uniref:thiamine pyrophosphate-dependent enzyme n=1 Tax=Desulfatibacillum aliphaticivorans TaxID=218208 RepID=UPI0004188403|nr:thiamine pyrophosphate-dependent enzyme [Desulfatibacillum aliphaticivorans]